MVRQRVQAGRERTGRLTVHAIIQAHPARADLAEGLLDCLGTGEIVFDPEPTGFKSPWRTYQACVRRGVELGGPFLVIQEDVLICDRFLEGVATAVAARPDNPLAFFVPAKPPAYTNAVYRARDAGSAFAELPTGTWAPVVALAWPETLAQHLLQWIEQTRFPPAWRADDEIIGRFVYEMNTPILATVPSLVEHPDTVASVMNNHRRVGDGRDPGRRAYIFIGDDPERYDCDATRVEWDA